MKSELELLTEGIGILLAWRLRGAYEATSIVTDHEGKETVFDVRVRTLDGSYRVIDRVTGAWESFSATEGAQRFSDREPTEVKNENLMFQHAAVRLSFPLCLPIWNQHPDDYRFTGAARDDEVLILQISNVRIPWLEGKLEIDLRTRDATSLTTPGFSYRYEGLRPISPKGGDFAH